MIKGFFNTHPNIYKLWLQHQSAHWMTSELCFDKYAHNFNTIPEPLKTVFFKLLAVFTVLDIKVSENYIETKEYYDKYPIIQAFHLDRLAREMTHIDAYSQILTITKNEHHIYDFRNYWDYIGLSETLSKHGTNFLHLDKLFNSKTDVIAHQNLYGVYIEGALLYAMFFIINDLCEMHTGIKVFTQANQWSFRDEYLHYLFSKTLLEMTRPQYNNYYLDKEFNIKIVNTIGFIYSSIINFIIKDYEEEALSLVNFDKYEFLLNELLEIRFRETTEDNVEDIQPSEDLYNAISKFNIDRLLNQFEIGSDQYTKGKK